MMYDVMIAVLERPIYGFRQVDALLGLSDGTARRWIDGYEREHRRYVPVIRPKPTSNEIVTWGEFVEARLIAQYRRRDQVPMQRLRDVVQILRERLATPYPLAHQHLYVHDRDLIAEIQDATGLDESLHLVVVRTGQALLTPPAEAFYNQVDWADDTARAIVLSEDRRVVLDPLRAFGEPTVRGFRTDILAEQVEAGDSIDAVARIYKLEPADVRSALDFEAIRRAA